MKAPGGLEEGSGWVTREEIEDEEGGERRNGGGYPASSAPAAGMWSLGGRGPANPARVLGEGVTFLQIVCFPGELSEALHSLEERYPWSPPLV